jgi:hypothetical protein
VTGRFGGAFHGASPEKRPHAVTGKPAKAFSLAALAALAMLD